MRLRAALVVALACLIGATVMVVGNGATGATSVRITAAGDYYSSPDTAAVLSAVAGRAPDAHIALGDLSYQTTPETAWCAFVKARVGEGFPFELLAGNHEMNGQHGHINNFSSCLPNQVPGIVGTYGREYFFDLPRSAPLVRMINVSPGLAFPEGTWSYALGDTHYTWLANAIDGARAAGIPFVVVGMHYPCLSVGVYSCPLPRSVFDLMLSKQVDLVMHGHEHAYMRSHQLRQGVAPCPSIQPGTYNAGCVADSDGAFTAGTGTVFATVGTGGVSMRDLDPAHPTAGYFAALSGANLNPTFGALELNITATQLSASFLRASGGTLSDAFTITRDGAPTPPPTTPPPTTPPPTTPPPTTPPPTTPPPTTPPPTTPPPTGAPASYLRSGAVWRLNDSGADLGTGWRAAGYSDGAWKSGPSQWGYGDGDERTVLTWGSNAASKPVTVYGRTTFDAGAATGVTGINLRAIVDDGAVVYLNGTEVWRFNLPTGTITASTLASRYIAGSEESLWRTATLPASALRPGTNTIAVEVHQDARSSSDISFDLEMSPVIG